MTSGLSSMLSFVTILAFATLVPQLGTVSGPQASAGAEVAASDIPRGVAGQARTLLPDGHWLFTGGEGADGRLETAVIWDPATGASIALAATLQHARAWHTATVLPDGTVLIVGGVGTDGHVLAEPEVFDPSTQTFSALAPSVRPGPSADLLTARAAQTATLLTDGTVLIAGGLGADGQVYDTAELWDIRSGTVAPVPSLLSSARDGQTATLLADGTVVLWGGFDAHGSALLNGARYDPGSATFVPLDAFPVVQELGDPQLAASQPATGTTGVALDAVLALRFSHPLAVTTVNAGTVLLVGPNGVVPTTVVAAEAGMLAFVTPDAQLAAGAAYVLLVSGGADTEGRLVAPATITFDTRAGPGGSTAPPTVGPTALPAPPRTVPTPAPPSGPTSGPTTAPSPGASLGAWQALPPLQASAGVTAIAGQVLRLNGQPLAGVTLAVDTLSTQTDATGRFLLTGLTCAHCVLLIDGETAGTADCAYGTFEVGVDVVAGKTTALDYTIWMPKLDTSHPITIPPPTSHEIVLTTPRIRGLEIRLPPNTVLRDRHGDVVSEVTITPVPLDRPPFPLPDVHPPVFFTLQPGGTYIDNTWHAPARIIYPNPAGQVAGKRLPFWDYDPDVRGWYVYGMGRVSVDGRQIAPEKGVGIYEFSGAMVGGNGGQTPPADDPVDDPGTSPADGDPVDLATGVFVLRKTDLFIPDIIPISLTRVYRTNDNQKDQGYPFGVGMKTTYDMYLYDPGAPATFTEMDLVLPDGATMKYMRTSPGTGYQDAIFAHRASDASCQTCVGTPTQYYASQIVYDGHGWDLTLKNGTDYFFNVQGPLEAIRDRHGNTVTITRETNNPSPITRITSPSGRYIDLSVGTAQPGNCQNVVLAAVPSNGRSSVTYGYDNFCRLTTATFSTPESGSIGTITYTYQPPIGTNHTFRKISTITDLNNIMFLTNTYTDDAPGTTLPDPNARVTQQLDAAKNPTTLTYNFVCDAACSNAGSPCSVATQCTACGALSDACDVHVSTNMTDPRGTVRQVTLDQESYISQDIRALGVSNVQQITQYRRDAGSHRVIGVTEAVGDPLQRTTAFTYLPDGTLQSVTRLASTFQPATTRFTYDPFAQVHTITDPLNHVTTFNHDALGNLIQIRDADNVATTLTPNERGQVSVVEDALHNKTQFLYQWGDLIGIIDPLGNKTTQLVDAGGNVSAVVDPVGNSSLYAYDSMHHLVTVADPLGHETQYGYDANGNLSRIVDADTHAPTAYTIDNMDRAYLRTDPLSRVDHYFYDAGSNLTRVTDRRGLTTVYGYDALGRRNFIGYNAQTNGAGQTTYESSVSFSYDTLNRLTTIADSMNGTITRTYDGLDRITRESSAQGIVTYAYNAFGGPRRLMTIRDPTGVITTAESFYYFSRAGRLKEVELMPSAAARFKYDHAGRRKETKFRNAWKTEYTYDAASRLIGIQHKRGRLLGELTYAYDGAGRRTGVGGSWARTALPAATSARYDDANQILAWGTHPFSYDSTGNLLSDGVSTYTWNSRGQLASIQGPVTAGFQYDGVGRRISKTVNGVSTSYLYDGWNVVQELAGGSVAATILNGLALDERYAYSMKGMPEYFLTDALNSTMALVDRVGNLTAQFTYDPFGGTAPAVSAPAYQYTGRENDGTGLYYYRARYYSPALGRFISEDPVRIGTLRGPGQQLVAGNRLSHLLERLGVPDATPRYAWNDPVDSTDPIGEDTFQLGVSGGLTVPYLGTVVYSAGIVVDSQGNWGVYQSGGGGDSYGESAFLGVSASYSTAVGITDLNGPFANYDGAAGDGIGGSTGTFAGNSPDGPVVGITITGGGAVGDSGSVTITGTQITPIGGSGSSSPDGSSDGTGTSDPSGSEVSGRK